MTQPALVTLILDLVDGSGAAIARGACSLTPSVQLTAPADTLTVTRAPVQAGFNGARYPQVRLYPTDAPDLTPAGWGWDASFSGIPGNPAAFSFFLAAGPAAFTAASGTPAVFTLDAPWPLPGGGIPPGTGLQLAGSPPPGFTTGTTYYTVNPSGLTFQLAAAPGGTPAAGAAGGSGTVTAVSYYLSSLTPVSDVTAMAGYLPLPSGTPAAGWIPVATGTGEASAWALPAFDIDGGSAAGGMFPAGTINGGHA